MEEQNTTIILGDDRGLYIDTNIETYIRKFNQLEMKSSKIGWNWCAFLFNTSWMLYRKLYGYALFFFFAPVLLDIILLLISPTEWFYLVTSGICSLGLLVCGGLYSDYWYKQKIDKLVRDGINLAGEEKDKHIKKGGTNVPLLALFMLITFFVNLYLQYNKTTSY